MSAPHSKNEFSGKNILVTGASCGIGLSTVEYFERHGANVIRVDIKSKHNPPWSYATDLSQLNQIDALMDSLQRANISIDLLAHIAAVLKTGPLLEMSIDDWLTTFATNTHGAFYLCQQVGKKMANKKSGAMVLVGSNCANTPRLDIGGYAASKAATQHMFKCMGLELAEFGVRCNVVAPGSTDTAMQRQLWTNTNTEQKIIAGEAEKFRLGIPLKKIAQPQDIAKVVAFLLSNSASHITLETITVDGGATLGCNH